MDDKDTVKAERKEEKAARHAAHHAAHDVYREQKDALKTERREARDEKHSEHREANDAYNDKKDELKVERKNAKYAKRLAKHSPMMAWIFDVVEEDRAEVNGRTPFDDEIKVVKDVVYKEIDGEKIVMDIYLPPKRIAEKSPVVFDIPGGGWMIHNRLRRTGYARLYAKMGAVVCVIDHRLVPKVLFPDNLKDVIDGLNFLQTVADEYGMDLNNVTVTGDSSGGHLTACVGCAASVKEYGEKLGLPELKVKPVRCIFISGAFSFETMYHIPMTHLLIVRYFSGETSRKEFRKSEFYKEADPYNYLTDKFPPSYNSGGKFDILCLGEAKRMADKLTAAGVDNEYYVGTHSGSDHCYILRLPFDFARNDMKKLLDWYYRQEKALGADMTEGWTAVQHFIDNYDEDLGKK